MESTIPVITDTSSVYVGNRIHRSNENVCYHGKWLKHPEAGPVVIKKLIVNRADSLQTFNDEVDVLSLEQIKPYVVRPLAVVRSSPHYSIILPLMERGSIDEVLHSKGLPLGFELSLLLSIDCAASLRAVHDAGLIHRDIKAANYLVNGKGKSLLCDFGSTRYVNPNAAVSKRMIAPSGGFYKHVLDGTTLLYTAPEVLHNKPATQKSDIYGLAITLAELATGFMPYNTVEKNEADMHTVLDATYSRQGLRVAIVNHGLRPPLRIHRHDLVLKSEMQVPEEFNEIIEKCWQHDPEARPTAQELHDSLCALAAKHNIDISADRTELFAKAEARIEQVADAIDAMDVDVAIGGISAPVLAPGVTNMDTSATQTAAAMNLTGSGVGSLERGGESIQVNASLKIGAYATSGMRGADKMEDRHAVTHSKIGTHTDAHGMEIDTVLSVCSVFDGHGGALCADYCAQHLNNHLHDAIRLNLADQASRDRSVMESYVQMDSEFRLKFPGEYSGCTAISVGLWDTTSPNGQTKRNVLVANLGDCRAILCKSGSTPTVRLSRDHNADEESERVRIEAAGGTLKKTSDGRYRVNGEIQVTRSLGDAKYKNYGVFAQPEVANVELGGDDEFLVVATDGVWDVMSDEDVKRSVLSTAREPGLAAKRIGGDSLARGSKDNVTVCVVFLKDLAGGSQVFKA